MLNYVHETQTYCVVEDLRKKIEIKNATLRIKLVQTDARIRVCGPRLLELGWLTLWVVIRPIFAVGTDTLINP